MVMDPSLRPGAGPWEVYPLPEKLSPKLPPVTDKPLTLKPPVEWRLPGEYPPGSVPLPKDLSDIVLIRQIGAQLRTAADRQDSTATPARAEGVACTSPWDFLDQFYSAAMQAPMPQEDREDIREDHKRKKEEIMTAFADALSKIDVKDNIVGDKKGEKSEFKKIVSDYTKLVKDWERESLAAVKEEGAGKAMQDKYKDKATSNIHLIQSSVMGRIAAALAKEIGGKGFVYATGKGAEVALKNADGTPRDGVKNSHQMGQEQSESCEEHGGATVPPAQPAQPGQPPPPRQVACLPNGYTCPKFESPKIKTGDGEKPGEVLQQLTEDVYSCQFPTAETCSLDCVRMMTLIWHLAGYGAFGDAYLKGFDGRGIWIGPIKENPDEQRTVWPWGVAIEPGSAEKREGCIVFINHTATMYLGNQQYLVPTGSGMQIKSESAAKAECAQQAGEQTGRFFSQYVPLGP
jgi:hypothetical protein